MWYLQSRQFKTSKKYAKTFNFLCAGNKHFVKYQAQGGRLTPTPPCVRPCLSIYIKWSLTGKKQMNELEYLYY